jgi:hypothetical protein
MDLPSALTVGTLLAFRETLNGKNSPLALHSARQRASMELFWCKQGRLLRATRQTAQRRNRERNGRNKAIAKRIKVARN